MGFADVPSADPTRTLTGAQIPTRVEQGVIIKQKKLMDSGKWNKMSAKQKNAWLDKTFKNVSRTLGENIPPNRLSSAQRKALKSDAQTVQPAKKANPTKADKKKKTAAKKTPIKTKDIPLDQDPFKTDETKADRSKRVRRYNKRQIKRLESGTPEQRKMAKDFKEADKLAAKKKAAKKPDAKKPDAKKPDAKKPDAKNPDAKKTSTKKTSTKKTPTKKTPYQQGMDQGKQAGETVTQKTKDVVDKGKDVGKKAAKGTAETTARNTGRIAGFVKGVKPIVKAAGPVGFVVGAGVDAIQMSDAENREQAQRDFETPNTEGALRDRKLPFDFGFSPKNALDATTGGIRQIWDDDATSPVELVVGGAKSLAEIAQEGEQPALDERMMYSGAGESMHNTVPAPPLDSSKYFTKEESAAIFKDVQEKIAQEKAEKAEKAGRAKMDNITPAEMRSILGMSPKPTETSTSTNLSSKIPAPERTDKPTMRRKDRQFLENLDLSVLDELVEAADEGKKDVLEPTDRPTEVPDYFLGTGDMKLRVGVPDSPLGVDVSNAPRAEVISEDPEDYTDKAVEIFEDLHGGEFNPKSSEDVGKLEKMKSMLADVGGIGDDKASVNKFALQFYRNS